VIGRVLELAVARVASPIGTLRVAADADGCLRALDFDDHAARMARLLRLHYGAAGHRLCSGTAPAALTARLAAFFAGDVRALDGVVVATGGTEFQRRVWHALRRIPAGATTTYGALARTLGVPRACRAVGLANGANPIAIVVPCHRVIGAGGALTGYGGGIERKRWLLAHERHCSAGSAAGATSA
jgi:methylated-DNA-[protein]-cysteine S-methyltransferase